MFHSSAIFVMPVVRAGNSVFASLSISGDRFANMDSWTEALSVSASSARPRNDSAASWAEGVSFSRALVSASGVSARIASTKPFMPILSVPNATPRDPSTGYSANED